MTKFIYDVMRILGVAKYENIPLNCEFCSQVGISTNRFL